MIYRIIQYSPAALFILDILLALYNCFRGRLQWEILFAAFAVINYMLFIRR